MVNYFFDTYALIEIIKNKKKKLSYADCIGYLLALKNRMIFLTGDEAFRGMPNIEFIK